jgi:hypothetical protein
MYYSHIWVVVGYDGAIALSRRSGDGGDGTGPLSSIRSSKGGRRSRGLVPSIRVSDRKRDEPIQPSGLIDSPAFLCPLLSFSHVYIFLATGVAPRLDLSSAEDKQRAALIQRYAKAYLQRKRTAMKGQVYGPPKRLGAYVSDNEADGTPTEKGGGTGSGKNTPGGDRGVTDRAGMSLAAQLRELREQRRSMVLGGVGTATAASTTPMPTNSSGQPLQSALADGRGGARRSIAMGGLGSPGGLAPATSGGPTGGWPSASSSGSNRNNGSLITAVPSTTLLTATPSAAGTDVRGSSSRAGSRRPSNDGIPLQPPTASELPNNVPLPMSRSAQSKTRTFRDRTDRDAGGTHSATSRRTRSTAVSAMNITTTPATTTIATDATTTLDADGA